MIVIMKFTLLMLTLCVLTGALDHDGLHHTMYQGNYEPVNTDEQESSYWIAKAQESLKEQLNKQLNKNIAKNVILFLGDGMSVPTMTATRIYKWQKENRKMGENVGLPFEEFPFVGLSRTYCVDTQVADSACSATAYLGGVKGNIGTIGVNAQVRKKDCKASLNPSNHVESIAQWAQDAGKSTGIVTTTRITHASPAGTFAHIADRAWECDNNVVADGQDPEICYDIAKQLIHESPGKNFQVILGGGRRNFLPYGEKDPVLGRGERLDRKNLIKDWIKNRENSSTHAFVWDRKGLLSLKTPPDYLLGLFKESHFEYHLYADENQPTLEEMTTAALKVLQKNKEGYFLFVEGGKIDLAHHDTKAQIAFDETIEFAKAIQKAISMTNENETLIVVTSDHAHTMSMSGYAPRTESIFGFGGIADDKKPYSIISYANGPGFRIINGARPDLGEDNSEHSGYEFPAAAPLVSETHGGDDVAVFARGPFSHLFTGSYEQNYIPHAMAYASCINKGLKACNESL